MVITVYNSNTSFCKKKCNFLKQGSSNIGNHVIKVMLWITSDYLTVFSLSSLHCLTRHHWIAVMGLGVAMNRLGCRNFLPLSPKTQTILKSYSNIILQGNWILLLPISEPESMTLTVAVGQVHIVDLAAESFIRCNYDVLSG